MRVDDSRDRVGGVVKSINKFKTERNPSASNKKKALAMGTFCPNRCTPISWSLDKRSVSDTIEDEDYTRVNFIETNDGAVLMGLGAASINIYRPRVLG
jgi:hypothetical protein